MTSTKIDPYDFPPMQVHAMFERVKVKTVGGIIIFADLFLMGIYFAFLHTNVARWAHVGVLILMLGLSIRLCIKDRRYYTRYRDERMMSLAPGWYSAGVDGWVKPMPLVADQRIGSGEQEMVSLSDQCDVKSKLVGAVDVGFYLLMLAMVLGLQSSNGLNYIDVRFGMLAVFLAVFLKWLIWGNAFFAGLNRLHINPESWEWGGWSNRFKKTGRWDDTRVLTKPITKWGYDRYFVVLGNDDGTIGMIVPKASVELIKRAYMSTPRITALPNDSHLCPAN